MASIGADPFQSPRCALAAEAPGVARSSPLALLAPAVQSDGRVWDKRMFTSRYVSKRGLVRAATANRGQLGHLSESTVTAITAEILLQ